MGFLRRARQPPLVGAPAVRGSCSCAEHVEDLYDEVVLPAVAQDLLDVRFTVAELVDCGALGVHVADTTWRHNVESDERTGPFHVSLWLGDETRVTYDDRAPLGIDDAIRAQPGVEIVEWEDREVSHVSAPTLCADGILAAAVRALLDPRVKG